MNRLSDLVHWNVIKCTKEEEVRNFLRIMAEEGYCWIVTDGIPNYLENIFDIDCSEKYVYSISQEEVEKNKRKMISFKEFAKKIEERPRFDEDEVQSRVSKLERYLKDVSEKTRHYFNVVIKTEYRNDGKFSYCDSSSKIDVTLPKRWI